MCQVEEYTFEITIDMVNMVERRTTQSENVKELRFSKNIGWSQFAYLKLRKTRSGFSIPLDFEIAKVACSFSISFFLKIYIYIPNTHTITPFSKLSFSLLFFVDYEGCPESFRTVPIS